METTAYRLFDWVLLATLAAALGISYLGVAPTPYTDWLLAAVSLAGLVPVAVSAFRSLRERRLSVDLLASIALIASLLAEEWVSAAFINLMLTSARLFAGFTEGRARSALKSLLKFRPHKVRVKRGKEIAEVAPDKVKVGDLVVVGTGDRVPVDGVVAEGSAAVDQSSLTGESAPVGKEPGGSVYSSTLCVSGALTVRVEKTGKDTTLEKIIDLVENSQHGKARIKTVAERFAGWYVGIAFLASMVLFFVSRDLSLVLAVLLVVCADDIAVAVPMAFLAAIGYAARRGVVVKGGNFLEGLASTRTFVVDKTGTLTSGRFTVDEVKPFGGVTASELLALAGATESLSEHPIAKSIVAYVRAKKVAFGEPKDFTEEPGKGTAITYRDGRALSGKLDFLIASGVTVTEGERKEIEAAKERGLNVTLFGYRGRFAGFIACDNEIRPTSAAAIKRLKELGVKRVIMLTGDNEAVAKRVTERTGVTEFHANLLPENKIAYLKRLLGGEGKVAMVGDGVNDAAAITLADIGIAMGAIGSDAAIEAADVALMHDNLNAVPEMVGLGRYTMRIARQDFLIWGVTNAVGLSLVFMGFIGPEGAAIFNFVTDFFPLLNSVRLFNLHRHLRRPARAGTMSTQKRT
jgi:heavy metal translocating P-type ATPase